MRNRYESMKLKQHLREVERGNVFKLDRQHRMYIQAKDIHTLLALPPTDFGALKYNTILFYFLRPVLIPD